MKTALITCFFNLSVRNLLETELFTRWRSDKDWRLVLLVSEGKGDFFKKEFGGDQVIIEEVPVRKMSFLNKAFHFLSWNLLSTKSKAIHRRVQFGKDSNPLRYIFISFLSLFGRVSLVRHLFRYLDRALVRTRGFNDLFARYRPEIIFASDIQDLRVQEFSDTALIREARRAGIRSVGMSRSWDSMTTKGLLRTLPDLLVVQSEDIRAQAIRYHSVPAGRVKAVGIPHYDNYISGKRTPRQEFFRSLGLDPARKLIFFAPPSDIWTGDKEMNPYFLRVIGDLGEQVIVRFPVFGELDLGDLKVPAGMVFDRPSNSAKLEESLLARKDDAHFADLIHHSDVVITGPSSVILDAAIFNKPTVLLGFDGARQKPFWQSLNRYYNYEHQLVSIRRGGIAIAGSAEELNRLTRQYLADPDREGGAAKRRAVAEAACLKLDGHSGERLYSAIMEVAAR